MLSTENVRNAHYQQRRSAITQDMWLSPTRRRRGRTFTCDIECQSKLLSTRSLVSTGDSNTTADAVKGRHRLYTDNRRTLGGTARNAVAAFIILCFTSATATSTNLVSAENQRTATDSASSMSLWDLISSDPRYTKLSACLLVADAAVMAALKDSQEHPLTLFAPDDAAFEETAWNCREGNDTIFNCKCTEAVAATELMSYHVSTTTSHTPYIGEKFSTLLADDSFALFYGISKSADVPASMFPIQFVDAANITATPIAVEGNEDNSYLYPLDRVLRLPTGTIWETLWNDPTFSLVTAALNGTDLARSLDTVDGTTLYTFFAPDNDAVRASAGLPKDADALDVLLSFHTVAKDSYPGSVNGAYFSQQLFKVDPTAGSLAREYYAEFYAGAFVDGQVKSLAGPNLNITRTEAPSLCLSGQSATEQVVVSETSSGVGGNRLVDMATDGDLVDYVDCDPSAAPTMSSSCLPSKLPPIRHHHLLSSAPAPSQQLLVEGVPISETDITAKNGVVHRLSANVMAPPPNVAAVLLDPPFPLSAAGTADGTQKSSLKGLAGDGVGFDAVGELVRLAWPRVNNTLTGQGPLTVFAPTDSAFDLAIAAGNLPSRPWWNVTSASAASSLTPERAARLLLSHTLQTPDGPLLFSPSAADPFVSDFVDGTRFSTAVEVAGVAVAPGLGVDLGAEQAGVKRVDVGIKIVEKSTRSTTVGTATVVDREIFVDGARIFQCVDGDGVGHACGSNARPSNTYALNDAHLCVVHAVDGVLFPADPETDLATALDNEPSLSRFSALLKQQGLSPLSRFSRGKPSTRSYDGISSTGLNEQDSVEELDVLTRTSDRNRENSENFMDGRWRGTSRIDDGGLTESGAFLTVFAPTNSALQHLEKERPWLFHNSSSLYASRDARKAAMGGVASVEGGGAKKGPRGLRQSGGWNPLRELLAYHIVPGGAAYSRYFNASSQQIPTLSLNGAAPIAVAFSPPNKPNNVDNIFPEHDRPSSLFGFDEARRTDDAAESTESVSAGLLGRNATLRANLQTCTLTDISASNGVLHVLDYFEPDSFPEEKDALSEGVAVNDDNSDGESKDAGRQASSRGQSAALRGHGLGTGVLVPDVLELTYALGYRKTYGAVVSTAEQRARIALLDDVDRPSSEAPSGRGREGSASLGGTRSAVLGQSKRKSVAEALRGEAAHTLLVVGDGRLGNVSVDPANGLSSEGGLSRDTLRYETLVGDHALHFPGHASVELETLLGHPVHAFNNSQLRRNPYFSWANDSGLYVDQAQVLSSKGGMVALNGRIHEISEPARPPAANLFALLSSHAQLQGWADWVQLTGLAELLADPTAGPFTVFAPVDEALARVPGRATVEEDKPGLKPLVEFHIATGIQNVVDPCNSAVWEAKLFTPSLANATERERSVLAGERFFSGKPLETLLKADGQAAMISVQVATSDEAAVTTAAGEVLHGGSTAETGLLVFVGPAIAGDANACGLRSDGSGALSALNMGAFASEVVLPNLNALNGVVHGISGVLTYPGYKRPVATSTGWLG